jgi:RNA polymerase sigma-70 factor, ECF subfamily
MDDTSIPNLTGLLNRAREGDRSALGSLLESQRQRLERMLAVRLDGRLGGRMEASDVIQDAFLEAARRIDDYFRNPSMPFYLWVRFIVTQRLQAVYRENLGAHKRDLRREVSLEGGYPGEASSKAIAAHLIGKLSTPSQAMMRAEFRHQLREALDTLDPMDREVIALRNFEQLGNIEVAMLLGIDVSTASKRHIRAIRRLRDLLSRIPGMAEYPWK